MGDEPEGLGARIAAGRAGIAHLSGQDIEKRAQTVCRRAAVKSVAAGLAIGSLGAASRRDGIALDLCRLILMGEEQFAPGFAQMPFDVAGEHAQQDVGAHAVL